MTNSLWIFAGILFLQIIPSNAQCWKQQQVSTEYVLSDSDDSNCLKNSNIPKNATALSLKNIGTSIDTIPVDLFQGLGDLKSM